jgi:MFS family permease
MKVSLHIPEALRYRNYALYWGGMLVSIMGSAMQMAALLWHLRLLSDQPIVVSGIGMARFLPILLLAPFGGVVADRLNRRSILFVTQATMALTAAVLGLLTSLGMIQIWHIYLLSVVQAVAISFDLPARQSMVPNLVPRKIFPNAYSMQSIASNTGNILGPALGGLVIGYIGQQYTYYFNAISYGALILALVMMGSIPQEIKPHARGMRASLSSIKEGVQFIMGHPVILSSMVLDFIATFFSSANTLLPFIARDLLHVNEVGYGWLASGQSIGAMLLGLIISQRANLRRQGALLLGAVVIYGLATTFLGFTTTFMLAMLALILIGGADAFSAIIRNTVRQLQTPDYIRGRMTSINQIFFQGGPQLGEIEAGLMAQAFGTPLAIISGGIGCILGVALIALRWPQLRRYDGVEDTEPVLAIAGK